MPDARPRRIPSEEACLAWWPLPLWWRWPWLRVHVDGSGAARLSLSACRHRPAGLAWASDGVWYLLRASEGDLALQFGDEILPLEEIVEFTIERDGPRRRAQLLCQGRRFEISYRSPADRWWNRADLSFDGLDELLADFFVFVRDQWTGPSGRRALAAHWSR